MTLNSFSALFPGYLIIEFLELIVLRRVMDDLMFSTVSLTAAPPINKGKHIGVVGRGSERQTSMVARHHSVESK